MDPKYTKDRRGNNIATSCRICGKQLLDPAESKQEYHNKCIKKYKTKTRGFR